MSRSQFQSKIFILRHAWLNLWDERMTTGRINQVATITQIWRYFLHTPNHPTKKRLLAPRVEFCSWSSAGIVVPVKTVLSNQPIDVCSLGTKQRAIHRLAKPTVDWKVCSQIQSIHTRVVLLHSSPLHTTSAHVSNARRFLVKRLPHMLNTKQNSLTWNGQGENHSTHPNQALTVRFARIYASYAKSAFT